MYVNKKRLVLGTYLFMSLVFLPLFTPLRQLGVFAPAMIRAAMIPLLLVFVISILGGRILTLRSYMSLALLVTFGQAAIVGMDNAIESGARAYFSHLFQLFSATVMLAAGAHWSDDVGEKFWQRFATMTLVSGSVSTMMSMRLWNSGDIERYYSPAYILIFVVAYGLSVRPKGKAITLISFLVALVANKRGPLISMVMMLLVFCFAKAVFLRRIRSSVRRWTVIVVLALPFIALVALSVAPERTVSEESPITRAMDTTVNRLLLVVSSYQSQDALNSVTSGRFEELNLALESINGIAILTGNGAGWTTVNNFGRVIQNIHFTPMSLVVVFGLPFAVFFYLYSAYILIASLRPCLSNGTITERMAVYYLFGSIFHTLVAYSIFIDLLNFFFIGVLVNAKQKRRRCLSNQNPSNENLECQTSL